MLEDASEEEEEAEQAGEGSDAKKAQADTEANNAEPCALCRQVSHLG